MYGVRRDRARRARLREGARLSVDYVCARSLEEALNALALDGTPAHVLAGGTDLMVELRTGRTKPARVVDVWKLAELRGVREEAGGLRLGALTTCAELARDPCVAKAASALVAVARDVGAEQIQARATLGGNLGTASPAGDLCVVLVALGARVRLRSLRGVRELDAEAFLCGYRSTLRERDELIESILIPARPAGERQLWRKLGTRRAQSISKVALAVCMAFDGGRVSAVRAAAGAVGPRILRLAKLEQELMGARVDAALARGAGAASARLDVAPIDDVRSTGDYRRHALARMLATAIRELSEGPVCRS